MFKRVLQLLILALLTTSAFAANDDLDDLRSSKQALDEWRLIKHDKIRNIKAYDKRDLGKNLRSFKIEYEIEADLDDIARVYFDFDNYKKWFYQVLDSKLLKKVSPHEFYYYSVHQAPATLPDRDAIVHGIIEPYNAKRGYALLKLEAIPKYLPEKPPLVRMPALDMTVKYTPMGNGTINVVAIGYFEPGGFAPSWAVNYVQRQGPYLTVLGFIRMIKLTADDTKKAKPEFPLTE